jgi:dCTP diphosphatase
MSSNKNSSFHRLRESLRLFVRERDWDQFHTPRNVALALAGECGELCAIFQWKKDSANLFTEMTREELVHLGEEIADVFVYNTRLADLSGIDLVSATKAVLFSAPGSQQSCPTDLTFPDAMILIENSVAACAERALAPRDLLFQMNSSLGHLSALFASYGAVSSILPLPSTYSPLRDWSTEDIHHLSTHLSTIAILMLRLSALAGLVMADLLDDKIAKNAAKYPAHLVKGSSKKYTAYSLSLWRRLFPRLSHWSTSSRLMLALGAASLLLGATGAGLLNSYLEAITVEV